MCAASSKKRQVEMRAVIKSRVSVSVSVRVMTLKPKVILGRQHSNLTPTSTKGIDIVSPMIGLNEDQMQYYTLARTFADNEMRPYAGKKKLI